MNKLITAVSHSAIAALFSLLVWSCGNGGMTADGGIGGTGVTPAISYGSVTAFGSVFVNGVEFDTRTATVSVEGVEAGVGDQAVRDFLAVGRVVRVSGAIDGVSGSAIRINYNDNLTGPIGSVGANGVNGRLLVVLGQTVMVDDHTTLTGTTLAGLADDMVIEVSGLMDSSGIVRATYVEKKADAFVPGTEIEVKGVISSLDRPAAGRFGINALTVDYASVPADLSALPLGLADGQYVRVIGAGFGPNGELLATRIAPADTGLGTDSAKQVELEGLVTAMTSTSDFTVGSQRVQTTGGTQFKGGSAVDIALDVRLEAEGSLDNGILLASNIEFKNAAEVESDVAAVDVAGGAFTLDGLGGLTVTIDARTKFSGSATSLAQIAPGNHVQVHGRKGPEATIVAREIDVKGSRDAQVVLKGPATALARPIVEVVGVAIDTTQVVNGKFDEFFRRVEIGDVVTAHGTLAAGVLTWQEVKR